MASEQLEKDMEYLGHVLLNGTTKIEDVLCRYEKSP